MGSSIMGRLTTPRFSGRSSPTAIGIFSTDYRPIGPCSRAAGWSAATLCLGSEPDIGTFYVLVPQNFLAKALTSSNEHHAYPKGCPPDDLTGQFQIIFWDNQREGRGYSVNRVEELKCCARRRNVTHHAGSFVASKLDLRWLGHPKAWCTPTSNHWLWSAV